MIFLVGTRAKSLIAAKNKTNEGRSLQALHGKAGQQQAVAAWFCMRRGQLVLLSCTEE